MLESWATSSLILFVAILVVISLSLLYCSYLRRERWWKISGIFSVASFAVYILLFFWSFWNLLSNLLFILLVELAVFIILLPIFKVVFELKFENEEKYGEIDGIPVIIGYEKGKKVYNAFYTPLKRKIFVTKSLKDVLSGEELKAVIYHESGHSKNKWWMITRSTAMMFWVLIAAVVLTTLFLLEMGKFQPNLKVSLFITLGALLIIYATFFMVFSWINEHEADLFAVKKSGYENFSKALFKTYFYNVLGDYAEFVGKIDLKNFNSGDVTPFEILKILLKQSIYYLFPRNILNQPIPQTHPPLRYRILLAHQTLKC